MTAPSLKSIDKTALFIWDDTNKKYTAWDGVLNTGDIEIGAVELKDADSATRANIKAANTARATSTIVVATQPIDASGAVLSTSALATSAKQLADGHNVTVDNASGGSAVNIQDGGNSITVDGTVTSTLSTAVPESGTDDVGADTYATILTPSTTFSHIMIINEGGNTAVVSIDGGSTETFKRIPTGVLAFDGVAITATAIQAKNASSGENYTNLTIIVW